jgi:hypothetical protein
VINQSMTTPGPAKSMLFGDFSKYIIRDVREVELRRLDERFAVLGQVAFLAFARADGDLLDAGTHPVKYMRHRRKMCRALAAAVSSCRWGRLSAAR